MSQNDPINQHRKGVKLDDGKIDMSLLEFVVNALTEICRVMTFGKTKYTRGGFLEVEDAKNRYTAAMLRHWMEECRGFKFDEGDPFYDTKEGAPFKGKIRHDAQLACNAIFRLECTIREELEREQIKDDAITDFYNPGVE